MYDERNDRSDDNDKEDINSPEQVDRMVDLFYLEVLSDPLLRPLFIGADHIDLDKHLPHIKAYWSKLLLGTERDQQYTMSVYRQLDRQQRLSRHHFERWLALFVATVKLEFDGPNAERAVDFASVIAGSMRRNLSTHSSAERH